MDTLTGQLNSAEKIEEVFSVLGSLESTTLTRLEEETTWIDYQPGDSLFSQGAPAMGLYILLEGQVKVLHRLPSTGKQLILKISAGGDLLGLPSLFTKENYISCGEVMEESTVGFIPRSEFFAFLKKHPQVSFELLNALCRELVVFEQKLIESAYQGTKQQVCRILHQIKGEKVEISRTELARLCGVSYKTIIQVLKDLEKRDLVKLNGGPIHKLQEKKLAKIADDFSTIPSKNQLL